MIQRARDYWLLLRLHRPTGLWLMLWPMLWALWLAAASTPPPGVVAGFVLGAFVLRSAACIVDDLADHWLHPGAERSPDRPIAQGRVSPRHALLLLCAMGLVLAILAAQLDRLALLLCLPGIALAATYPFARRLHRVPHAHLGFAFSWSIPMACAALRQSMPWIEAAMLMAADLCWVVAYDAFYALSSREFAPAHEAASVKTLFGRHDRAVIALLQVCALALLAEVGIRTARGPAYYGGLTAAAGFALWQLWLTRNSGRDARFLAFRYSNGFGAAVFAGLTWDIAFEAYAATQTMALASAGAAGALTANGCFDPLPATAVSQAADYGYCVQRDLTYTPDDWPRRLQLGLFTPRRDTVSPVVILVYGGDWSYGSRHSMDPVARALARRGYVVLNVSHRVIPAYRFPAPLQDLQQAVRWIGGKAAELHADPGRLGAWGFSSGAHLAAMLALVGPHDPWGAPDIRVRALVGDGLPSDLTRLNDHSVPVLLGATLKDNPKLYRRASPLYQVTRMAPPTFLYAGREDEEVPLEQALLMRDALLKAGVPVQLDELPGAGHSRMDGAELEAAMRFLDQQLKP